MNTKGAIMTWGAYGVYAKLICLVDSSAIKDTIVKSRGSHPDCGDGPYFKGISRARDVYINGSLYQIGNIEITSYASLYICAGNCATDRVQLLQARNSNPWNVGLAWMTEVEKEYSDDSIVKFKITNYNRITGDWSYDFDGWRDRFDWICNKIRNEATISYQTIYTYQWSNLSVESRSSPFDCSILSVFDTITATGIYPGGYAQAFSAAYVNAVDDFDLVGCNTLANVVECVRGIKTAISFIKSPFKTMKSEWENFLRKGFKGNVSDAWLSYRYVYTTSKMDIAEYKDLIQRLKGLRALLGQRVSGVGSFSNDLGTFRAKISVLVSDVYPDDVSSWLDTIGLTPSAQNVWDMIPYSFIVDWFFHVGSIIDYFDRVGNSISLPVGGCWFTFMNNEGNQFNFFRVPGKRLDVLPAYKEKQASTTTIRMRIADSIALFL